jgi:cation transport ATPase
LRPGGPFRGDRVRDAHHSALPVDGIIADGLAMIDQHTLIGESMPAENGVGDRVFA